MSALLLLGSRSSPPPLWWFFVLLFCGTWILVSFSISRASGWTKLAQIYAAQQPFSGTLIRFQAAQFRRATNYNGCLDFGSDMHGLYIVPMLIFRAFHPPLRIPWSEVTAQPIKVWRVFNFIELRFQRAPDCPVRIKPALAKRLVEASAGQFRSEVLTSAGI
jgi:hypothetical protein